LQTVAVVVKKDSYLWVQNYQMGEHAISPWFKDVQGPKQYLYIYLSRDSSVRMPFINLTYNVVPPVISWFINPSNYGYK
jgi:hypothetical protein